MWRFFKRRHEHDLRRLVSAYRFFLKAAHQTPERHDALDEEEAGSRTWKGGFGRAFNLFFHEWPTPVECRRFEALIRRRLRRTTDLDRAFIRAFNAYVGQRPLTAAEQTEVLSRGRARADADSHVHAAPGRRG